MLCFQPHCDVCSIVITRGALLDYPRTQVFAQEVSEAHSEAVNCAHAVSSILLL